MPSHKKPRYLEYKRFLSSSFFPKASIFLHGFEDFFLAVIWAIFMFLFLGSYEKVGSLTSIMLFVASVFLVLIGYFMDRGRVLLFLQSRLTAERSCLSFTGFLEFSGGNIGSRFFPQRRPDWAKVIFRFPRLSELTIRI